MNAGQVAILAAAVGAGGAIIVQIIAAIVNSKMAHHASDEAWRRQNQQLFFDSRRIAYTEALRLAQDRLATLETWFTTHTPEERQTFWHLTTGDWHSRWHAIDAEIDLLDSSVEVCMVEVNACFHAWEAEIGWNFVESGIEHAKEIEAAIRQMRDAMQDSMSAESFVPPTLWQRLRLRFRAFRSRKKPPANPVINPRYVEEVNKAQQGTKTPDEILNKANRQPTSDTRY